MKNLSLKRVPSELIFFYWFNMLLRDRFLHQLNTVEYSLYIKAKQYIPLQLQEMFINLQRK